MIELPNVPAAALARQVVRELRKLGHVAYLAGGCVRDLILQRTPKDYDVATSALAEQVEAAFRKTVAVGKSFGVITVLGDTSGVMVEVATFRHDGPYSDGRHPDSVRFTNAEEDAARRDFTINALFLDPETGEVVDYVNGVRDLEARVVRAVGDPAVRFSEDKLRLLRAVRFACALNFDIDDATLEAIKRMALEVSVCSKERIRDELNKMLLNPGRGRAFGLLFETSLLEAVLPEVAALHGKQSSDGNLLKRTLLCLDLLTNPPALAVAWAALLRELGPGQAVNILRRLRSTNDLTQRVEMILTDSPRFATLAQLTLAQQKRFLRKPGIEDDLELLRTCCLAGVAEANHARLAKQKLDEFRQAGRDALWPTLPISGDDLRALGIAPGPVYKDLLTALEDEMLEGRIRTKEQALAYVRSRHPAA